MEKIILEIEDGELPKLSVLDQEFDGAFGDKFDFIDMTTLPASHIRHSVPVA